MIAPSRPESAGALARVAECLYHHHSVLVPVLEARWLARLDALAATPLGTAPAPLTELLERLRDSSWLVIDALGLTLFGPVRAELDAALPASGSSAPSSPRSARARRPTPSIAGCWTASCGTSSRS